MRLESKAAKEELAFFLHGAKSFETSDGRFKITQGEGEEPAEIRVKAPIVEQGSFF
jgi:hypothetical protein